MPPKRKTKSKPRVVKPKRALERYPRIKRKPTRRRIPKPIFREEQKECKQAEYLIGPISLDILDHPQTGARIILLGDAHVDEKKCPPKSKCGVPIWSYLEELFQQYRGSEFIDFFLEIAFTEEARGSLLKKLPDEKTLNEMRQSIAKGTVYRNFLTSIRIYFIQCFQRIKTQCAFYKKPIRFHYSDVRQGVIHSATDEKSNVIVKQLFEITEIITKGDISAVKENHILFLLGLIDKFQKNDIDYFFRLTKIDKQLQKIQTQSPEIVELLREYMEKYIESNHDQAGQIQYRGVGLLTKLKTFPHMPLVIWFYTDIVGLLLSPLFDIYTLARLFRYNMKQVIIYAGDSHTEDIKKFLVEKIGFQLTVSKQSNERGSNYQCISLKNVPQPWFQ